MFETYDTNQKAFAERTGQYYDLQQKAWVDVPSAMTYDTTEKAWVEMLKKHIEFGWVYSTGTNEASYEYQPKGSSAFIKSIVTSTSSRNDLILKTKAPKTTSGSYSIEVSVTDIVSSVGGVNASIAFGYIDVNGETVHVSSETTSQLDDSKAIASINASEEIDSLYICLQCYGNTNDYIQCDISDFKINNIAYIFK